MNDELDKDTDEILIDKRVRKLTRRGFLVAAGSALVGGGGYAWLKGQPNEDGILWPLRRTLQFNEKLWSGVSSNDRLSREYPLAKARMPRVNGVLGLTNNLDVSSWRLQVTGLADPKVPLSLSLAQIQELPKTQVVTEIRCIEGWSEIVHWGGVRVSDFVKQYPMLMGLKSEAKFLGAITPNEEYYVGLDIESALHPQTLLCYEMNGQPLEPAHGAPLRLAVPVKYGIKSIKGIGSISFTSSRPADYWAERGYDFYSSF